MQDFNEGRPYHGSNEVEHGKLRWATGRTDYFNFFCPICPGDEVMRILEYGEHDRIAENPYNEHFKKKAKYGFTLVFKLHCEKCTHTDFVKVSNTGYQLGQHRELLA